MVVFMFPCFFTFTCSHKRNKFYCFSILSCFLTSKPSIIMPLKPGPKPNKPDGTPDQRRRVTPESKPKHPTLKPHEHKRGDWYGPTSEFELDSLVQGPGLQLSAGLCTLMKHCTGVLFTRKRSFIYEQKSTFYGDIKLTKRRVTLSALYLH